MVAAAIIKLKITTMAKHAKRSKRRTGVSRRRRRVGAMPAIDFQGIALATAGTIIAAKLQTFLARDPTKTTMVNLSPFAGLVLGIGLPMFVKNPTVKALAVGMTAFGGYSVLKKLAPGIVGNFAMTPIISSTSNQFRNLPKVSVNGLGFPLPRTSVYKDSMSVVNGVGSHNPMGSGAANPGY